MLFKGDKEIWKLGDFGIITSSDKNSQIHFPTKEIVIGTFGF